MRRRARRLCRPRGPIYWRPQQVVAFAREDVARVLAERIEEGQMTERQALKIARQWFFDNAVELYRLEA